MCSATYFVDRLISNFIFDKYGSVQRDKAQYYCITLANDNTKQGRYLPYYIVNVNKIRFAYFQGRGTRIMVIIIGSI